MWAAAGPAPIRTSPTTEAAVTAPRKQRVLGEKVTLQ
jgi:hypothetical protein